MRTTKRQPLPALAGAAGKGPMFTRSSPATAFVRAGAVWLAVAVLGGCAARAEGPGKGAEIRTVSAGSIGAGAAVPPVQDRPVLVVRGVGLRTNSAEGVTFDAAGLDALPTVEVRIRDPWEKRSVVYRGVLMSELLDAVGAPSEAREVTLTAVDAYEVRLDVADLRSGTVLLATRADGRPMEVKEGGPTKIVFLPSSAVGKNKDRWIWSIKDMVIQ